MTDASAELSAIRTETHRIAARDDTLLAATLYRPAQPTDVAVLIAGAIGVPQTFYRAYATYLARCGCVVLTFDYRGIGQSLNGRLRRSDATLLDWGAYDLDAALAWLRRQYPAHALRVVAHSIGGQLLGLAAQNAHIDAVLGIAAQNAHWSLWAHITKAAPLLLWSVLIPVTTRLAGYFPAEIFGLGKPLPQGVALDWARAGRKRYGLLDVYADSLHNHYAELHAALRLWSFADDTFAPARAVRELAPLFPNATLAHRHIVPREIGATDIGHFGFFRETAPPTLWQQSAAYLQDPSVALVDTTLSLTENTPS